MNARIDFAPTLTTSTFANRTDDLSVASLVSRQWNAEQWPMELASETLTTPGGLVCKEKALVATYAAGTRKVVGTHGARYQATTPSEWISILHAAEKAGATVKGGYTMADGGRVMALFDLERADGLSTSLLVADSFDGSLSLTVGFTVFRHRCSNVLASSLGDKRTSKGLVRIRHTSSLSERIAALKTAIPEAIAQGTKMRETYEMVRSTRSFGYNRAFNALFPEAVEGATKRAKTTADSRRDEARVAAALPINDEGAGNLATLWNAATYLVDRSATGARRQMRGGSSAVESMAFGARARRIEKIRRVVTQTAMAA